MTILNVVQPDEFDPSSFTVIDGKLKVAISSQADNILQYKNDGLYAPASNSNGVINRSVLNTDEIGSAIYKGVIFNLNLIDGALSGIVYGEGPTAINPEDNLYYSGGVRGAIFDDEKYVLELPWAVEHEQRVVMQLRQDGNPVIWVARFIRQRTDSMDTLEPVTIIIDEMINVSGSLDLVVHDNSPKPVAFTATWDRNNGHILLNGQIANTYTDNWTYFRLEVDTPSGETHSTKRRTGSAVNGVFTTSLWVIAEPGEYVFRVSHWDGGPVMEARATVPSDDGLDFTPPTVTPDGDGSWILSTTNAGAAGRGYKIYRSRDPISIIDEYYNGSRYITDVAENDPGRFTIPTSDRNGIWYIMVGQIGTGGIWTPTFFTYGE